MARARCEFSGTSTCRNCAPPPCWSRALSSINAFQAFALQYVLPTDPGGPANSTLVLGLLVLKYGFQYFRMGDAAAVSVVMFALIMAVTLVQLWFNRRARGTTRERRRGTRNERARSVRCGSDLIALVIAVLFAFPIWFMVTSAFKAETEIEAIPMHLLPWQFQGLAQFRLAAEIAPMWTYFLNSWLYALTHVGVTVFFGALAGFGFAKYRFPGRGLLFLAVLSTIMVPFQVLVVPLFIEVKALGWENSYPGLLIPGMMNAFGVFMMRQYASDLPDELLEAARVDGASEFRIFLQIALPLLLPALASLAIIVFIWSWGAFLWPLVIVQDKALNVLSVGLTTYTQPYQRRSRCGARRWRPRRWRPSRSRRCSSSSSATS